MSSNKKEVARLLELKKLQELYGTLDKAAMQEWMKLEIKYSQYADLTSIEIEEDIEKNSFGVGAI